MSLKATTSCPVKSTGYIVMYPSDGPTYTLHHSKLELHLKLALKRMHLQEVEATQLRANNMQQILQISNLQREIDELQVHVEKQQAINLQQAQQLHAKEQQLMQLQKQLRDREAQLSKQQQLIDQQGIHILNVQEQLNKYNYLKPHIQRTIKDQMQQIESYKADKAELQQQCEDQLQQLRVLEQQLTALKSLKSAQHSYEYQPSAHAANRNLRTPRQLSIATRLSCDVPLGSTLTDTMPLRSSLDIPSTPSLTSSFRAGRSTCTNTSSEDICFSWMEPTASIAKQLSSTSVGNSTADTACQSRNGRDRSKLRTAATTPGSLAKGSSNKLKSWWLSASAAASAAAHRVHVACVRRSYTNMEMQALPCSFAPRPL